MSPQKTLTAAEDYFSNINPIASRIYADFEETKSSYDCIWSTLSFEEQSQILNECIIKPEVTLQYSLKKSALNKKNEDSDAFGKKRIVDEHVSYRDEHSAPFSFKTSSQVDLRLFSTDARNYVSVTPKLETPKAQPPPAPATTTATSTAASPSGLLCKLFARPGPSVGPSTSPSSASSSSSSARHSAADEHQALLVSPQSSVDTTVTEVTDDVDMAGGLLPKTGLDFLDNW